MTRRKKFWRVKQEVFNQKALIAIAIVAIAKAPVPEREFEDQNTV